MAVARIAAIVLALCCSTLTAQQAQLVRLSIKVTDVTGTVIPGARIQIDRMSDGAELVATSDRDGKAALNLSPGTHDLTITARLFERWQKHIEVKNAPDQEILAVMEVDCTHMICDILVTTGPEMPTTENQLIATDIPLLPTRQFLPPAKPFRPKPPPTRPNPT